MKDKSKCSKTEYSQRGTVKPSAGICRTVRMIPNILTALRIAAAICLIFLPTYSKWFYTVYIFGGVTDVADGFIARAFHFESELGSKLDSAADLIFWITVCCKVLPVAAPQITIFGVCLLSVVLLLRIANYIVALAKLKRFPALHTILNKLTGAGLFVSVLLIGVGVPAAPVWDALCLLALAAVLHELTIHIKMK